jgi:hypothetical protein
MYPRNRLVVHWTGAHAAFATATLLLVGLAGCATERMPGSNPTPAEAAPYVGGFTGEFVDGRPLYRFPAIEIVGSRSSIGSGT